LFIIILLDSYPIWGIDFDGYAGPIWSLTLRFFILICTNFGIILLSLYSWVKANSIDSNISG